MNPNAQARPPTPTEARSAPEAARARAPFPLLGRLRVRLILLVVAALLPALGLVIYNAIEQRSIGLDAAREDAFRLAHLASARQDDLISNGRQLLLTLSQLQDVQRMVAPACQAIFTNLLRLHPAYANIGLAQLNGDVVASGIPINRIVNIADRTYFQRATNRMEFAIGDYQVGRITRKSSLNIAYPIRDTSGALQGVLYAAIDLNWMQGIFASADLPPGSSYTIYDRDYITLARYPDPNREYVGQKIGGASPLRPPSDPARPKPVDRTMVSIGRDGVLRLYASTQLGENLDNTVRVTFGIPVSVAFAESNRLLRRNLLFLGGAAALAFLAAWFGGHFLVLRRVNALLDATRRLHEGDLGARTGVTSCQGELDQLALAFDDMARALELQFAERHRAEANLKSLNETLERRVTARTAQLKRSNEDLEQFAYVASHDLQEPLRMVTSYLDLIKKRYQNKLDADAHEFIGFAVDGAERMQQLIKDLLAYSRVQTKAQPFQPIACDTILDQVLENLQVAIRESGARIHRGPLPSVAGDPSQLTQLFQNLVSNALKFHGDRPPEIHVEARLQEDRWIFSIRDNGIGIPSEHFERIFVIFQRLHTRQQYPGTGIGLSICKKIVDRHGGKIWVESNPGQGTTFFFSLPARPRGSGTGTETEIFMGATPRSPATPASSA